MSFFNKYPYTDFHELNLDWLLEHYKELVDQLQQINAWVAQHKIEYNEAIARLTALENEINTFETQIRAEFARLKAEQQAQLDAAINSINIEVDNKLNQLSRDVQAAIDDIYAQYDQLQIAIANELNEFRRQVNNEITSIRNEMRANNQLIFEWVENRIEDFINSLPEILTVQVYNPYRGEVTDIQTAINDIYSVACIWGLTAQQYDDLGLTAEAYDALELTAVEYDTLGYKLLYPDPNYYMISPFTGEMTHIKNVVTRLCYFHMEGLTAEEYDAKELTAEAYDAYEITAFDYDWFGEQLLA